ncbi:hypothetical protein MLD38_007193 [Melastoma candidum]|uniref:Uncharacterized protein n=1 Tax=Melastoma candidum TaxID=119954 RepID=A0ACB9RYV9_9MYRT|nr:hypothetical protein MLD38_007193 [Melastoma candidum]
MKEGLRSTRRGSCTGTSTKNDFVVVHGVDNLFVNNYDYRREGSTNENYPRGAVLFTAALDHSMGRMLENMDLRTCLLKSNHFAAHKNVWIFSEGTLNFFCILDSVHSTL